MGAIQKPSSRAPGAITLGIPAIPLKPRTPGSGVNSTEDYVLACYRYIELNPVRAGMVMKPQDYRWSSYPTNALGKANRLITPHDEYGRLGRDDATRRAAYRALFKAHLEPEVVDKIRSATNGNFALGSERFQKEAEVMLGRRVRRGQAGRPSRIAVASKTQGALL